MSPSNGAPRNGRKAHGLSPEDDYLVKQRLRLLTGGLFEKPSAYEASFKPASMRSVAVDVARILEENDHDFDKYRRKFDEFRSGKRVPGDAETAFMYGYAVSRHIATPVNGLTVLFWSGFHRDFVGALIHWVWLTELTLRSKLVKAMEERLRVLPDLAKQMDYIEEGVVMDHVRVLPDRWRRAEHISRPWTLDTVGNDMSLQAWQSWVRGQRATFNAEWNLDPDRRLAHYNMVQFDALTEINRIAGNATMPLDLRERLLIDATQSWLAEHNRAMTMYENDHEGDIVEDRRGDIVTF